MTKDDEKTTVTSILASSTMHGISHAAATDRKPLKVMWILLFFLFLGLFFYNTSSLVQKLFSRTLSKSYELDKAEFEFPDLYFCPNNPYSGSIPYTLTKDQADEVNSEIIRVLDTCKLSEFCDKVTAVSNTWAAYLVQKSLPARLIAKYLAHSGSQSVISWEMSGSNRSETQDVKATIVRHPENVICFRTKLTEKQRHLMRFQSTALKLHLSTDPFFPDFNFTGHRIMDITNKRNESLKFRHWHSKRGAQMLKSSGYRMLMVPPDAYPSMEHEHSIRLAPGNSYKVKISMDENVCSDELHGEHCTARQDKMLFKDFQTHGRVRYNYSYANCYQFELQRLYTKTFDCLMSDYPIPWALRDFPRCFNLTEMALTNHSFDSFVETAMKADTWSLEIQATKACTEKIPCKYLSYTSSFSFEKWPSLGTAAEGIAEEFGESDLDNAPAMSKLVEIAGQLSDGSHSAHLEGIFRSYVSESLISVEISAASAMSPQVTMAWSYSVIAFLADAGGLLGLYIGCSVMSVFELLSVISSACGNRCPWGRRNADGGAGGAGKDGKGGKDADVESPPPPTSDVAAAASVA